MEAARSGPTAKSIAVVAGPKLEHPGMASSNDEMEESAGYGAVMLPKPVEGELLLRVVLTVPRQTVDEVLQ